MSEISAAVPATLQRVEMAVRRFEDVYEGGMAIMPMIGRVRMLRSWGGIVDMSMDGSPIIDHSPASSMPAGLTVASRRRRRADGALRLLASDRPHETADAYRLPPGSLRDGATERRKGPGRQPNHHYEADAMRIVCPSCGAREVHEFVYRGEVIDATETDAGDAAFNDYQCRDTYPSR